MDFTPSLTFLADLARPGFGERRFCFFLVLFMLILGINYIIYSVHPVKHMLFSASIFAPVAQLDRATDF